MKYFNQIKEGWFMWTGLVMTVLFSGGALAMSLLGFQKLHEPAHIEVICPEDISERIDKTRDFIENLGKKEKNEVSSVKK